MRVNFETEGEIEVFDAVATLETYQSDRNDMLNLMKHIEKNGADIEGIAAKLRGKQSKVIAGGIIKYLKTIGLLDYQKEITKKGKIFLKTGKFPKVERGQFKFWKINHPLTDGHYLINYKRETRRGAGDLKSKDNLAANIEGSKYVNLGEQPRKEFKIIKFDRYNEKNAKLYFYSHDKLNTKYQLRWEVDLDKSCPGQLYITGNIKIRSNEEKKFQNKKLKIKNEVDYEDLLINLIEKNVNKERWNREVGALGVQFKDKLFEKDFTDEERLSLTKDLEVNNVSTTYGIYNTTTIKEVPLMPADTENAQEWLEYLLADSTAKRYINKELFTEKMNELKSRKEFKIYNLESYDYINFLENMRGHNMAEYWNLQASLDLRPEFDDNYLLDYIDITQKEEYSIGEIVKKIAGTEEIGDLIFSCKYLSTGRQINNLKLFLKAFEELGLDKRPKVVTKEKIKNTDMSLKVKLYKDVYGDNRQQWPHDRYFAFNAKGEWNYYKLSANLDRCRFPDISLSETTVDTIGIWGDISILKVKEEVFPEQLLNLINKEEYELIGSELR